MSIKQLGIWLFGVSAIVLSLIFSVNLSATEPSEILWEGDRQQSQKRGIDKVMLENKPPVATVFFATRSDSF